MQYICYQLYRAVDDFFCHNVVKVCVLVKEKNKLARIYLYSTVCRKVDCSASVVIEWFCQRTAQVITFDFVTLLITVHDTDKEPQWGC